MSPGRKPAGGDAPRGGPVPFGEVLDSVVRDLRLDERKREGALVTAWDSAVTEVAGQEAAAGLRPVAFRGGVLTVEVDGAPLLHRVRGFWTEGIRAALAARPAGARVRQIRYVPRGRTGEGGS